MRDRKAGAAGIKGLSDKTERTDNKARKKVIEKSKNVKEKNAPKVAKKAKATEAPAKTMTRSATMTRKITPPSSNSVLSGEKVVHSCGICYRVQISATV